MRISGAGWVTAVAGASVLVACADAPVAPRPTRDVVTAYGPCTTELMTKAGSGRPDVSLSTSGVLPGVTVWATYTGATFGLPFNLVQQMNYGYGSSLGSLNCFGDVSASYAVTSAEAEEPIPTPPGVDADWWTSLSPREQAALLKLAHAIMSQSSGVYRSPGEVIRTHFQSVLPAVKQAAKIRAMDYFGGSVEGELLTGGIYGCLLYRKYQYDAYSPIANRDLLDFASTLVAAFGEAQFSSRPLTGLRFGRNGLAGAALAAKDASSDCGFLVFQDVNRTIDVRDPYTGSGSQDPDR